MSELIKASEEYLSARNDWVRDENLVGETADKIAKGDKGIAASLCHKAALLSAAKSAKRFIKVRANYDQVLAKYDLEPCGLSKEEAKELTRG